MAGISTVTGIATNVSSNVLSGLWNLVVQDVKMVISLPQALTDMQAQAQRLGDIVHDINEKLAQEQKPAKRIVRTWLDKANGAIESSRSIYEEYHYRQHKYCLSCCPNCLYRYRISKDIVDWKLTVAQLHSEKQSDFPQSGDYSDHTPAAQISIEIPETGFVGNAIQSGQLKLEQLLTEDTNIRIIAVHGMGGVGKTSLLQTINNSLQVRNSFDLIIWVTVSKDCEISSLQDSIAKRLNLHNFPDTLEERKHRLNSYLGGKKFLMILDDMWRTLELHSLGVPLNDKGSKVVLTTRIKQVCTGMGAGEIIEVKPLSEDEGWQLFCIRVFPNGNVPQEIADVAREIAWECKGLPLAINVIAAAMRNHTYRHEWEYALSQIQNIDETFYGMHDEAEEKLFQRLKWSYNGLPDYLKTCFLCFAAYPEDTVIICEEVIDSWIAEGLVKGSGDSYLPDTAHSFINFLRDRCLIEVVKNDEVGRIYSVKIHDVLRDLAIRIAEKEHRCYFKAGQGMTDFAVEEVHGKGWERMSLMDNHLHSLPTTFACSSLSVLLLSRNSGIKEVPGSFLRELSSLKVLDLSETGITSLPPCLGNLKHLASLQLQSTAICELPETIGDLKELQFLNVNFNDQLLYLPERISELKRLRALDIVGCKGLSHLPRGISELVSLERLRMESSISLDFEEDANAERKNASLKDLQSLRRLRVLGVRMKSPIKVGVMGNWSKMRYLRLECSGANQDYLPQDMQAMKDLEYFWLWGCDVERLPSWVNEFRKLACLVLWSCEQLKELPAELHELPCLRTLQLEYCDKLEVLELGMGYPKLHELCLDKLGSLESVGAGAVAGAGAAASGGGGLAEGASSSGGGGLGEGASMLPMLKTLDVRVCPRLKRMRGRWDELKCLESISCDNREWWDAIQWDNPTIKTSLEIKFKSS